jgi:hypothetical protein
MTAKGLAVVGGEERSALALAIEAEGRHVRCVPLDDFFGPGRKPIGAVAFRVAVKSDEDAAIIAAHRYAAEEAKVAGSAEMAARSDSDLLGDAKNIEALYRVCMAAEAVAPRGWKLKTKPRPDGQGSITSSAFPGPQWMRRNLTTDQIAYLMNAYLEVRAEASPSGKLDLGDETIDALAQLCADHLSDDLPELALARFSRVHLTHAFVMLADKYREGQRAVEALLAEKESAGAPSEPTPDEALPATDDAPPATD